MQAIRHSLSCFKAFYCSRFIKTGILCVTLLQLSAVLRAQSPVVKPDTLSVADPTIFSYRGADATQYYLYGTAGDKTVSAGFKGFKSSDLIHWQRIVKNSDPSYLVLDSGHSYGNKGFWAPQILSLGGDRPLLMAYTANEQIAIASSANGPQGPFIQNEKMPLFNDGFKHIDPFIYRDSASGKTFIYYVKLDKGNKIYVSELKTTPGGSGQPFKVVPGTEKKCIEATVQWENTASAPWPVTEGPTVLFHQGYYYLFYSANDFRNPDYAVGYATSKSPTGPWVKSKESPVISRKNTRLKGSGHGDVLQDAHGKYYYVFHAHHTSQQVSPRMTFLIPFQFKTSKQGPDKIKMDYHQVKPMLLKN